MNMCTQYGYTCMLVHKYRSLTSHIKTVHSILLSGAGELLKTYID